MTRVSCQKFKSTMQNNLRIFSINHKVTRSKVQILKVYKRLMYVPCVQKAVPTFLAEVNKVIFQSIENPAHDHQIHTKFENSQCILMEECEDTLVLRPSSKRSSNVISNSTRLQEPPKKSPRKGNFILPSIYPVVPFYTHFFSCFFFFFMSNAYPLCT